ncbi:MAG: GNAT family N-acetyltransferase [Bacillota bacterium]|nr:GNAT family N-acetyltransferase [Bacillota bacterium]
MNNKINTKIDDYKLRFAEEKDVSLLYNLIMELAAYESLEHQVKATEEILKESIFQRKAAEAIILEYQDNAIGYIILFENFSTFTGLPGIYIEDLYIKPEMRGKGFGKVALSFIANLALERNCGRVEWSCLNWNIPSIKFYKGLGAKPMDEWTIYRLAGEEIKNLADNS